MLRNVAMGHIEKNIMFVKGPSLAESIRRTPDKHGDGCTVWLSKEDAVDEWARVLEMRRDEDPLVLGAGIKETSVLTLSSREQQKGLSNSRRTYKPKQPSIWR